jgi:hypothetical protein
MKIAAAAGHVTDDSCWRREHISGESCRTNWPIIAQTLSRFSRDCERRVQMSAMRVIRPTAKAQSRKGRTAIDAKVKGIRPKAYPERIARQYCCFYGMSPLVRGLTLAVGARRRPMSHL